MIILILNSGSSSLKFQLFHRGSQQIIAKGVCERIGMGDAVLKYKMGTKPCIEITEPMPTHKEAINFMLKIITTGDTAVLSGIAEIAAIGHRMLHGGEYFDRSVVIDDEVMKKLEMLVDLGPLHMPPNIMGAKVCREIMPNKISVAVFDTAFHQTMPDYAYMYALQYELYEKYRIRRYGFHGSSHRYIAEKSQEFFGKKDIKIISAHLGNGGSLTAIKNGQCLDTSMGLTPLEGIIMGTRSGSIDPAIIAFLQEHTGETVAEICNNRLNKKSGILGFTGVSSDQRDVEKAAVAGDKRCQLALKMQAYSIKKYIGSYIAALNGIDALVFTGGIGENCELVRERICSEMSGLGIVLDKQKNSNLEHNNKGVDLSAPDSKVKILVIETDEEFIIARDVIEILLERKEVHD